MRTKVVDVMLSYWEGDHYIAPRGSYIYQSQSIDHPLYTEKNRELLFIRLMREQLIFQDLYMTLRFEPVYDLQNKIFDYSYSFYLSYKKDVAIKSKK